MKFMETTFCLHRIYGGFGGALMKFMETTFCLHRIYGGFGCASMKFKEALFASIEFMEDFEPDLVVTKFLE